VLEDTVISPVLGFIVNPEGDEEKVPPDVPVIVGVGSVPVIQNVPDE